MRECWINVSCDGGASSLGYPWGSRRAAIEAMGSPKGWSYRLHVRLKPEPEPVGMTHGNWERFMGRR